MMGMVSSHLCRILLVTGSAHTQGEGIMQGKVGRVPGGHLKVCPPVRLALIRIIRTMGWKKVEHEISSLKDQLLAITLSGFLQETRKDVSKSFRYLTA